MRSRLYICGQACSNILVVLGCWESETVDFGPKSLLSQKFSFCFKRNLASLFFQGINSFIAFRF